MTPAEKILWNELRANKLGVHFRRQQVIAGFIVDFYCHKSALVIEVDGIFTTCNKMRMPDARMLCAKWGLGFSGLGMMRLYVTYQRC